MTPTPEDLSNEDFDVKISDDDLVIHATLDRPDQKNAMNENIMVGLNDVLDAADESEARLVVIRGAGGTFCSGGDLSEMSKLINAETQEYREYLSSISNIMSKLRDTDALTLAVIEGYCLAGGMGVATSCDLVVADEEATFGTPEKDSGLFPMQVLAPIMRSVHQKKGMWMMFTGDKFGAEKADDIGLLSDVYGSEEFEDEVQDLIDDLVNASPTGISMGKEAYYSQEDMAFDDSLDYLKEMFSLLVMSEDTKEGLESMMMQQDPDWKKR
ncbi:MAG: enoyl-CoA hydratase/isomerase family protein [Halobacteria archaeon]